MISQAPQGDFDQAESNCNIEECWVMTTKRAGDVVAGWQIDELITTKIRELESSERCKVTSFCYPPGARMIKAKLHRLSR